MDKSLAAQHGGWEHVPLNQVYLSKSSDSLHIQFLSCETG